MRDILKQAIPFRDELRRMKRRLRPYVVPDANIDLTVEQVCEHMELLAQVGWEPRGKSVLELGTGWQPTLCIAFKLFGAGEIITADVERLMDFHLLRSAIRTVVDRAAHLSAVVPWPAVGLQALQNSLSAGDLVACMRTLGLRYLAPYDTRRLPLDEASVDLVASRAVLEHIPPDVLRAVMRDSRRLMKPGAMAVHTIDNSDHFQHQDARLSRVNFLRYERTWTLISLDTLSYQNRLRHSEYQALWRELGFEVIKEVARVDQGALMSLESMPVARQFRGKEPRDLATLDSVFLLRKPLSQPHDKGRAPAESAQSYSESNV